MIRHAADDATLGESVVEEVRAIRLAIDAEAGHDIRKLAQQAGRVSEEVRRQYGMTVAKLPPTRTTRERDGTRD